jgi:hypothetical protein
MRCVVRALLLAVALSVGGCGIVDQELNNRGGYIDHLADHWFKADSKKMRVLRAVALEVTLARIAMIAPKSTGDRDLLARRIGDTSKRGALVAGCAFTTTPAPCFYFDSAMTDYVSALFDLAVVALPIEDAHKLLNRIAGGVIASNPVDLMSALIDLGREAIRYGRVAGAIYRDTIEMEVQVWLDTPRQNQDKVPAAFRVTEETVTPLRAIYERGNDDLRAWKAELERLHGLGLEPVPTPQMVDTLFGIIGYLCDQISGNEDARKSCKVRPALQPAVKTSREGNDPSFSLLAALSR